MRGCYLYQVTHRSSGKAYVGISVRPFRRWIQHRHKARHGHASHFHSALRKHGPDAFEWSVLAGYPTKGVAAVAEMSAIRTGLYVYNHSAGGEISIPDAASVRKIWAKRRGKPASEQTRKNISDAQKRRFATGPHPRTGVPHSAETRKRLSEITLAQMARRRVK